MRYLVIIFLFLILICSCRDFDPTTAKSLKLTMTMKTMVAKPCINYTVDIKPNGQTTFIKNCNSPDENKKYEIQLGEEQLNEIIMEVEKSDFFAFKNKYSDDSQNCSQYSTDSPIVTTTINLDGKQKTIEHNWGCWVNNWFDRKNALEPLRKLENKIDEIVGTKQWIGK